MSNIKSLLYTGSSKFNTATSYSNSSYYATGTPGAQGCQQTMVSWCQYTVDTNYCHNCLANWCVPKGVCCITFEIWGGGGGGAGGCCCMQGQPGGAGAYAYKTLTTAACNFTYNSCQCYTIQAASTTDCAVTCCGIVGCNSWITGSGLNNFCATGGCSGKSCCFTFWGNYSCAGNNTGYVYLCYDAYNYCACYYGADGGAPGRPGLLWSQCSCASCYWKYGIQFPGGLVNQCGGTTWVRVQGDACNNEWTKCVPTIGWSVDTDGNFIPGMGAPSATSCGGGCCYGFPGAAGMVRMTYR